MLTSLFLKVAFVGAEWVLWILLMLSFVSIGIIADRFLYFWRTANDSERLAARLPELLRAGDVKTAWEMVSSADDVASAVVAAGLQAIRRGSESCEEAMLSARARLKGELDAWLSTLGTIGSNAPFIGLMGTVLGVIKSAHDLSGSQAGPDPNAVMSGVFEALIATAVGLFVAIPAVIAYNHFQRKVRATLAQIDSLAHLVLANVHAAERRTSTGAPAAVPQMAKVT